MRHQSIPQRNFLFLQGPPGPFFWQLAQRLESMGCGVSRINLNGGDQADWPGESINYRGTRRKWTLFIDRFLSEHNITDLLLFGDCRAMHLAAHQMAQLRKIDVHVFEEGYIRPDWITLEASGVNGNSSLPRDPQWYRAQAETLPPIPDRPTITASFPRRARDAFRYYQWVFLGAPLYPFYQSHRSASIVGEAAGWLRKGATRSAMARRTEAGISAIEDKPYFLFPLQLSNDFQIRQHSPFQDMTEAVNYVLYSFARRAPDDAHLLVKEHPLDASFTAWHRQVRRVAKRLGLAERIHHIAGGDLAELTANCRGLVTVNSTSATLSLIAGVPTKALGKAVYNIDGITHQGKLDDFWIRPQRPDPELYEAFRRVLHDRCLVYGGLASQSAVTTLIDSTVARLVGDEVGHRQLAALELSSPR